MQSINRLFLRTEGQDLIEYALLASIISVSVVLVLGPLGSSISSSYDEIETTLASVGAPAGNGGGGGNNGPGNSGGGGNNGAGSGGNNGGGRGGGNGGNGGGRGNGGG